ncbi:MAG: FtsQ-type POTRA domain-containing protein [Candidatus Staskawiczbacteria bacterium]|nr:FtsQ-type POTRA domain-containing protein [Candidatus Staskawiczbacteria bacterium]
MSHRRKHLNQIVKNLRPKKRIWKSPVFWAVVLCLVIVASFIYLVFFWSKFQIQTIQIAGNAKVQTQDIENVIAPNVHKKLLRLFHGSIFVVDTSKITADILNAFPVIEKVDTQKKYPDSVAVSIIERDQFAIFCENRNSSGCFSIDKNGVIFEKLQTIPKDVLLLTQEPEGKEMVVGEAAIDKKIMDGIFQIQEDLKNNFQIDIQGALVSNPLIVRTSENWKLYFDPDGDMPSQITKMNLLLKDQILPSARKNLEYIYLQYNDRAYYR